MNNKTLIFLGVAAVGGVIALGAYEHHERITHNPTPAELTMGHAVPLPAPQVAAPVAVVDQSTGVDSATVVNNNMVAATTPFTVPINNRADRSDSPTGSNFARLSNADALENWSGAPKVSATGNWSANSSSTPSATGNWSGGQNTPATGNWSGGPNQPATGTWTGNQPPAPAQ